MQLTTLITRGKVATNNLPKGKSLQHSNLILLNYNNMICLGKHDESHSTPKPRIYNICLKLRFSNRENYFFEDRSLSFLLGNVLLTDWTLNKLLIRNCWNFEAVWWKCYKFIIHENYRISGLFRALYSKAKFHL